MGRNIAITVAFLVGIGLAWTKLGPPGERARVQRMVKDLNAQMPRALDSMVSMTRVELDDKTVKSWYAIKATFETDAATTAAVRQALLKQACADQKFRDVLGKGYTFDNHVAVDTPHGPDEFHILIQASDCP